LKKNKSRNKLIKQIGHNIIKRYNHFTRKSNYPHDHDLQIKNITIFNENIESFWIKLKEYYHYIIVRDMEYLNWRYCDPRGGNYTIKEATIGGTVVGYSVLRIDYTDYSYPVGYIVDLMVSPRRYDVMFSLIKDAISYFEDTQVNVIQVYSVKNMASELFQSQGFITDPQKTHVFLGKNTINEPDMNNLMLAEDDRVHFAYGDHDHI
jgi:hypothetical protein